MESKVKVTVFTLAYNAEKYIAQTIESVLGQTEPNFEYVIRDNGSTDGTYDVIKSYAEKDGRIKIVRNKVNHKKDDGTQLEFYEYCPEINGEYWTVLDSDDLLEKNYIEAMYQESEGADIVIAGTEMFADGNMNLREERIPPSMTYKKGNRIPESMFEDLYGNLRPLWGKLYRTEFFLQHILGTAKASVGYMAGGDTAMSLYMFCNAEKVVCIPRALHCYRVRTESHYHQYFPGVDRILDGEKLLLCGIGFSDMVCDMPEEGVIFLYSIFEVHLQDLADLCFKSEEASPEQKIEYCELLMNNPYLAYIRKKGEQAPEVIKWFINLIKHLCNGYQSILKECDLGRLFSYWSVCLFFGFCEKEFSAGVRSLLTLLGIFDERNIHSFGVELDFSSFGFAGEPNWLKAFLSEQPMTRKALIGSRELLKRYVENVASQEVISREKQGMLDAAEKQDWQRTMKYVYNILDEKPIDLEAYYFGVFVAYQMGNQKEFDIFVYLAGIFYPGNEEIDALLNQITGCDC